MTAIEIIKETKEFYTGDVKRRALGASGVCEYVTSDGLRCALGRCMVPDANEEFRGVRVSLSDGRGSMSEKFSEALGGRELDDILQPAYRGHSEEFWSALQHFHDAPQNWDSKRLTGAGKGDYNELLKKYKS